VTGINNTLLQEQKERVRKLFRRRGWTLHLKVYPNQRLYAAAAKRGPNGDWHGVYIGSVTRLCEMTDEAILGKVPDVA